MSKTVKYIPLNPKEIQDYKRTRIIEERGRDDKTNNSLIALRRRNLELIRSNKSFQLNLMRFNKYVSTRKVPELVKVIKYLMSDFCN